MSKMRAQILKILNGGMSAIIDGQVLQCEPTGNVKKTKVMVGDFVELQENLYGKKYIVSKILDRKNSLIRPPIANLDQLFIIVSKEPKTDFLLVDKLIIYCVMNDIVPYIVINKKDLYSEKEINDIINQYCNVVEDVFVVSAREKEGIDIIRKTLIDKVSAFTGQSAVGKSTLINAICPDLKLSTNELSRKISRGKHTTRHSEIFVLADNIRIADTPGFSMLDLQIEIEYYELSRYYADFANYINCRYSNCDHTNLNDNDCMLANAVKNKQVNIDRYERYVQLYKILKEKWRKKYD